MGNLYKSEAELKWLKEQRNLIRKEIVSIVGLVADHILMIEEAPFVITCDVSMSMNGFSVRIYNLKINKEIDRLDLWNMSLITRRIFFDKESIEAEVKDTITTLRKYKSTVKKYIKLNMKAADL